MSSPVLAITERSPAIRSWSPAASFAPPVPPASSAIFIAGGDAWRAARGSSPRASRPVVGFREPLDADAGVGLVAGVDRDQHRGELLDDSGHLKRAGVHRAHPFDLLDEACDPGLRRLLVAADQHVLLERG